MHTDGLVAPGIFQLVTAISDVNKLHAQLASRFFKAARLIAQFVREQQQALGRVVCCERQKGCLLANDSHERFSLCQRFFGFGNGDQLVPRRFGSTVPRFVEVRDGGAGRKNGLSIEFNVHTCLSVRSLPDAVENRLT